MSLSSSFDATQGITVGGGLEKSMAAIVARIPDSLALYRGAGFLVDLFGLEFVGISRIFGQSALSNMAFVMTGPFGFIGFSLLENGCVDGGPVF